MLKKHTRSSFHYCTATEIFHCEVFLYSCVTPMICWEFFQGAPCLSHSQYRGSNPTAQTYTLKYWKIFESIGIFWLHKCTQDHFADFLQSSAFEKLMQRCDENKYKVQREFYGRSSTNISYFILHFMTVLLCCSSQAAFTHQTLESEK